MIFRMQSTSLVVSVLLGIFLENYNHVITCTFYRTFVFSGTKQNSKSQQAKKSKPLIRGQKEIFRNGRGDENVTTKLLSENKIKISEMRNKNIELADLISKYEAENRDLMRIIRKQEKMLKHFQEQVRASTNDFKMFIYVMQFEI